MGLLSIFNKKTSQEAPADEGHFTSRAAEESTAVRTRTSRRAGRNAAREDDEQLTEKKRARRRLVGAVALVLAVIIGLPMVFDSEPKALSSDIAIQIPSREKPPVPVAPAPAPAPTQAAVESASGETAVATDALDEDEEIVADGEAAAPTSTAAQAARPVDKPPVAEARPLPIKPAAPAAVQAPKAKADTTAADEAQRAAAILEGKAVARAGAKSEAKPETKPEPKEEARAAGRFMVQVAALATQAKIDELRGKLNAEGIRSSTQKVAAASGELTRVLVGPFASKDEAEKMRARLAKLGLNAKLVQG